MLGRWLGVMVGVKLGYWIGEDRTMAQHILLQKVLFRKEKKLVVV